MPVSPDIAERVRKRAGGLCEYCRLPQESYRLPFHVDHIIAEQHGRKSTYNNFFNSRPRCNRSKGPNIAGIDVKTRTLVRLFNPRQHGWDEHFRWRGPRVIGVTSIGRATIRVLAMNSEMAVRHRRQLITEGEFPPKR
jgi:HNH endonuclease